MAASRHYAIVLPLGLLLLALIAGCGGKSAKGKVPDSARLVSKHKGSVLFVAPHNGTLFIFDEASGAVIYSTAMKFQERLYFWPAKDQILYNNVAVKKGGLNKDHVHQFFFARG